MLNIQPLKAMIQAKLKIRSPLTSLSWHLKMLVSGLMCTSLVSKSSMGSTTRLVSSLGSLTLGGLLKRTGGAIKFRLKFLSNWGAPNGIAWETEKNTNIITAIVRRNEREWAMAVDCRWWSEKQTWIVVNPTFLGAGTILKVLTVLCPVVPVI